MELIILSWREFEKMAETGRTLWPSPALLPETGYKTLTVEVPSLHSEERSILISKMEGYQEESE